MPPAAGNAGRGARGRPGCRIGCWMEHSPEEAMEETTAAAAFAARIKEAAALAQGALDRLIPTGDGARARVLAAMRYSALDGGKRFRPFLTLAAGDLFDVPRMRSTRAGAALEMVHCYSLIHDDLPAMDNADLRRGNPSLHRAFDEATAILAGDGLLTLAFEVMGGEETHPDAGIRARLVVDLAIAAGHEGMVGGQMIDLSAERAGLDLAGVAHLQALKTGALIRFGIHAGAVLGGADAAQCAALHAFADDLGLAFQVTDDILDATSTAEELGKPAGQDAGLDKATFVKLLGLEGARQKAVEIARRAEARLAQFGPAADPLRGAARYLLTRKN